MSLDATTLATAIKDQIKTDSTTQTITYYKDGKEETATTAKIILTTDQLIEIICNKVIEHITKNAEVTVPSTTFLVGATAGVPNPTPVTLKVS
jgi:hypothetical protein